MTIPLSSFLLTLVLAAAGEGSAATVHRCRDAGGGIRFQDRACPAGREDPGWNAAEFAARSSPPAGTAADQARERQAALERSEQARWAAASRRRLPPTLGGPSAAGTQARVRMSPDPRPARPVGDACRQAREARDTAFNRDWMQLGFDQRSRLDAAVRSNCSADER